ncbi:Scr1 family TA system antitoxin-like transcriptional regulator [Streptomyces rugosispiralis]|uniref:Scr1 family TA system antitoxin-like transcriptional regulator n=1 Tax=Streptomyces rugosispiralis TaxID=2967341 RepID=A0ABT1V4F2_9ACTN|nr:Scr1 family TA system antitoxin-like transcriptional regulator [Streptomyces rugosispiralis]MCQ8192260.1 Scr1 family TA system antitoxin-like transcriptional regulator [Streptomyces rugosispiralis]
MPKDLPNSTIGGIIYYDLDRLVRQPRDLEDLANVVIEVKRPAIGATSELNLVRESDCNMARVMRVMLLKQSQDTARRVARDTLTAAEVGIPIGRLGYGWVRKGEDVGTKIEEEAKAVRRIFHELVEKNGTPSSITRGLTLSGISSTGGGDWTMATAEQLRRLLEMSELPNVTVRVVPFEAGLHLGVLPGPFITLRFPLNADAVETEPPTVYPPNR